jgi:hypothetical protein
MKLFGRAKDGDSQQGNAVIEAQRVDIKIRGVGRTSGTVEEIDGESVVIALVAGASSDVTGGDPPDAVLEYTALRGLYRQKGSANFDVSGGTRVRFVAAEEPELVQRRDFVRVDVNLPVAVSLKHDPYPVQYDALNLSGNGVLLAPPSGRAPIKIGSFVWMKISLYDGKDPIEVRGTAVRQGQKGAVGVRFDYIGEGDQERLARYVARQEREQRSRGAR